MNAALRARLKHLGVTSFETQILGTCVGSLVARGVTDDDVLAVVSDLLEITQNLMKDPAAQAGIQAMLNGAKKQIEKQD